MMPEHITAAIVKLCPFGKPDCFMARVGACTVIAGWISAHKCSGFEIEFTPLPEMSAAQRERHRQNSSKGGRAKQANRRALEMTEQNDRA